jgi:tRNA modification GTPase
VRAVLSAIPACIVKHDVSHPLAAHPVRYAEPGEFTRRAFANNRMTLPQIESLGETLSASTEEQRKLSVRGTMSSLGSRYEHWRMLLLQARGELEALIDFSEDQHFDQSPLELCTSVANQIRLLRTHMEAHVANAVRGELLRSGISVALLGAPNAGKSSLLNRIVGREAAIVSQEAGTTRDVIEVGIDLGGWLVKIGDMAGLRKAGLLASNAVGIVEQEGIHRAKLRALDSDVVIVVQDATCEIDPEVADTVKQCIDAGIRIIAVINKTDRMDMVNSSPDVWKTRIEHTLGISQDQIALVSCKEAEMLHGGNLQSFLAMLQTTFEDMTSAIVPDFNSDPDSSIWQESLGATERQRVLLSECLGYLQAFEATVHPQTRLMHDAFVDTEPSVEVDIVVAAELLRSAADSLARITGRGESGDVEEVLGVVFER